MKIIEIQGLQILDSRGNPTLQVSVILEDGSKGKFRVPSGASTGIHEAHELRDNDMNHYHGKSVTKAVKNINKIRTELYYINFNQKTLDAALIELDGTPNKKNLGANTILGVSVAFAKACAISYNLPLYEYLYRLTNDISFTKKSNLVLEEIHPFANVINGGLHSGNGLKVQEFMLIPTFGNLQDKIRAISEVYQSLKEIIGKKYGKENTAVGDEGGFAPNINTSYEALDLLVEAIEKSNYTGQIGLALDTAASDFYNKEKKKYEIEPKKLLDYKDLTNYYNDLIEKYPILSIEDPFEEDDFEAFKYFKKNIKKITQVNPLINKKEVLIVGDDLLVTNPKRIKTAITKSHCNSLLLKINQIGTLSESIESFKLVSQKNWHTIVSHRSGETSDSFIADLAVALNSSIKLGAPARGERVAKYNRLLEIFKES